MKMMVGQALCFVCIAEIHAQKNGEYGNFSVAI